MSEVQSVVLDFSEKAVTKIAFAKTREEAERIKNQLDMAIYFPSEIANFGDEIPMYILLDNDLGGVKVSEKNNKERLETALLEYIERNAKDAPPEIAVTIPAVSMALIELWKTSDKSEFDYEKQGECIYSAVSRALLGKKYDSIPKDAS